jgi:uncharacterized protein YcbK (DUF882 family)
MTMKHFDLVEFDSPDQPGSGRHMQEIVLRKLDAAREMAGCAFAINSGYRSAAHNASARVGGKPDSAHLGGWAADIAARSSRKRYRILWACMTMGFHRIGIGETFIHVDMDPSKDPEVVWLY